MKWVNAGAPRGNPADMPKALNFEESDKWTIGEPDLVVKSKEITVPATGPDQWGDTGSIVTGPHSKTADARLSKFAKSMTCRNPARSKPWAGASSFTT